MNDRLSDAGSLFISSWWMIVSCLDGRVDLVLHRVRRAGLIDHGQFHELKHPAHYIRHNCWGKSGVLLPAAHVQAVHREAIPAGRAEVVIHNRR